MLGNSKKPPESSDSNKAAPFEGAKRPSTEHVPLGIRPRKAPGAGFWDGNWITFAMMLPYTILFVVHEALGISDAALGGDRRDAEYNLWMMLALLLGSLCFLVHTFVLPLVKGGGWGWVAPKILFLGACWGALVLSWNLRGPSFETIVGADQHSVQLLTHR